MAEYLDTESWYYRGLKAAGYGLEFRTLLGPDSNTWCAIEFRCPCGNEEKGHLPLRVLEAYSSANGINVARFLEDSGQLSLGHLIQDGFTETEAREIRQRFLDEAPL